MNSTNQSVMITKRDFDEAVKQKWNARTCILAQTAMRKGAQGEQIQAFIGRLLSSNNAENVMSEFDRHFRDPGDETAPKLQELRSFLPVKVLLS